MEQKINNNLIDILLAQHKSLKSDLGLIKNETVKDSCDFLAVFSMLGKFSLNLEEHLTLENNVFYPEILKKMEAKNMDTADTKKFIAEMMVIQEQVMSFLKNYDSGEKIKEAFEDFKKDLDDMIAVLLMRIEAEEQGVYLYWEL